MRTYQYIFLLLIMLVVISICAVNGSAQSDTFPNNLFGIFGGQTSSQPNESQGSNSTMIPTATFENGKRYETNGLIITELHGNYREMGRQYGDLYRKELAEIDNTLKTDFVKVPGITVDVMQQKGQVLFDAYPQRYKEIMNGMAETSNISLEDIKMINAMELYIPAVASGWTGCSGFAAWGPYTSDGKLIF